MSDRPAKLLHQGRHLRLLDRGGWEYVERVGVSGVVVVVALTAERQIVLVEQFRPAVGARVLDMPAGLVGDLPGEEDEDLLVAARRELLEETGFEAERLEVLVEGPASAGSSGEVLTIVGARDCRRVGPGGGDEHEDIQVHVVPLDRADRWLDDRRRTGAMVDPKIYAGLYLSARIL